MAQQTEPGHIRHGVHAIDAGQLGSNGIQLLHRLHRDVQVRRLHHAFFLGCGQHAHPKGLGEVQPVTGNCRGIGFEVCEWNAPCNSQSKDGLRAVDAVSAGQRNARLRTDGTSAIHHGTGRAFRNLAQRPPEDGNGHEWGAAHGVDVTDGIRGGDAPKRPRVVDNGHEEIRGGNDAGAVAQIHHRRVVLGVVADDQVFEHLRSVHAG